MIELAIEPLTHAAFAPFGELIEAGEAVRHYPINAGNTERYHDLARLDAGPDGRLILSIFRAQPRSLPFRVTMLERHPLGSQAFMPLSGKPYLVVVAAPGLTPTAADLRGFLARGDQGVNYAAGTWHHPLLALDTVCDFLVLDRSGSGANCEEFSLAAPAVMAAIPA